MKRMIIPLIAILLVGCGTQQPNLSPIGTVIPAANIVTPEPTPTTAVCTPLPGDMTLNIYYDSSRHGVIEAAGLQPGERPTLILTGQGKVTSDWWRKETQYENAVGVDGRFQYKFDFRSWESVAGYEFTGQLIHQRGVACFTIDLSLADEQLNVPHHRPTRRAGCFALTSLSGTADAF